MHLRTLTTTLLALFFIPLSLALADTDSDSNATLLLAPTDTFLKRQSYTTFSPATPACPPRCPASSAPLDAGSLPAVVTGMCIAVGIAGIVGGLGLGMEMSKGGDKGEMGKKLEELKGSTEGKEGGGGRLDAATNETRMVGL